jgi:hypothetical protein
MAYFRECFGLSVIYSLFCKIKKGIFYKMKRRKKPDLSENVIGVNPFTKTLVVKVRTVDGKGYTEKGMPVEVELDGDDYGLS